MMAMTHDKTKRVSEVRPIGGWPVMAVLRARGVRLNTAIDL